MRAEVFFASTIASEMINDSIMIGVQMTRMNRDSSFSLICLVEWSSIVVRRTPCCDDGRDTKDAELTCDAKCGEDIAAGGATINMFLVLLILRA
jgi:hypothetical protein